ncbi:hypothetical protein DY000_02000941 [Brassica cretica]|uniref:F-box associated beta-propeller type 1 domain-containing protein n=1 Tax=Brassica cretica TaxID=69181 RepID=A0ABQ7BXQ0_BRACR|nr:hypothetical protein DY000_02000941 [Brassica cretica]
MHLNKSEPRVLLIDCNAPMVRVANVKSLFAMYLEIQTSVGVKRFSGGGVILCDRLLLSWTTASLKGYMRSEKKKRNVEMFSSGSWNIIGNLVDWYIISSRDGLSLGNNMVWLAREKVSTTDSILSFHFKSESFTKLYDSPVGSYLNGITSLNIYKSESERLSYMHQGTRDTKLRIWVSSPGPRLMVRLSDGEGFINVMLKDDDRPGRRYNMCALGAHEMLPQLFFISFQKLSSCHLLSGPVEDDWTMTTPPEEQLGLDTQLDANTAFLLSIVELLNRVSKSN